MAPTTKINKFIFPIIIIVTIYCTKVTSFPASSSSASDSKGSHLAIDIESCTCTPASTICEVTISRSIFGGNHCPDQYHFCCVARKSAPTTSLEEEKQNTTATTTIKNNAVSSTRVKIVVPTKQPAPVWSAERNATEKPRARCRCKLREKCAQEHTDYSFGFHCSYDKVRCCEPTDGSEDTTTTNITSTGRLINVVSNEETEKLKDNCRCLPEARCNIAADRVHKRKDTVCPDNLVQCCGELILTAEKKSDDGFLDDDEDDDEPAMEKMSKGFAIPPKPQLKGALQEGHTAHQQPVEIPLMKIPTHETVQIPTTSTLPPPVLPTQYYYAPQSQIPQYHHRYVYAPTNSRVQNPSNNYYINGDPGSHRYSDTYLVNHNGRGFKVAAKPTPSSGSIFSSLASFLG